MHAKLIDASAKLVLLKALLPKLRERGHRVLLFSQVGAFDLMQCFDLLLRRVVLHRAGCDRRLSSWRRDQVPSLGMFSISC